MTAAWFTPTRRQTRRQSPPGGRTAWLRADAILRSMGKIQLPPRILLGPGPSPVDDRVLRAMSRPLLGHLDPEFLALMDEIQSMLRQVMGTGNRMTFAISGTGSAGMEAAMVNLVEPGDRVVVGIAGVFGQRLAEQARRNGAELVTVETEWGSPLDPDEVIEAIRAAPTKLVAVVHAETSTGVLQPVREIAAAARAAGTLTVLDAVTSLGGHPVHLDEWGIDVCYSGTQKCLSCPPGLSPVSFNDRALESIAARATQVRSWYLDVGLLDGYWGTDRAYHHTAPVSMAFALHEALRIVVDEGEQPRAQRHAAHHAALVAGVEAMGLQMQVANPDHRLWSLNAIRVPERVDEALVRRTLLYEHGIEIGGGLGPLAGAIWRVGLMGAGSTSNNVLLLLSTLQGALAQQGIDCPSGVEAALETLNSTVSAP
jgi:alanine-glyoxylate transaminase/serine-glyoxylate transaminase/serine-pyruvate transaminase